MNQPQQWLIDVLTDVYRLGIRLGEGETGHNGVGLTYKSIPQAAETINKRFELSLGYEDEPMYGVGEAIRSDNQFDHASVVYGRNERRKEARNHWYCLQEERA